MHYIVLHCIILYYIVLHFIYYIILYYIILYYIILYYIILYWFSTFTASTALWEGHSLSERRGVPCAERRFFHENLRFFDQAEGSEIFVIIVTNFRLRNLRWRLRLTRTLMKLRSY